MNRWMDGYITRRFDWLVCLCEGYIIQIINWIVSQRRICLGNGNEKKEKKKKNDDGNTDWLREKQRVEWIGLDWNWRGFFVSPFHSPKKGEKERREWKGKEKAPFHSSLVNLSARLGSVRFSRRDNSAQMKSNSNKYHESTSYVGYMHVGGDGECFYCNKTVYHHQQQ